MRYRFRASRTFWRSLWKLSPRKRESARGAFRIFKQDPFDPRLRPHKIHRLSAQFGRKIFAVEIEADLRALFYVEGNDVVTVDIGSHDIYRA